MDFDKLNNNEYHVYHETQDYVIFTLFSRYALRTTCGDTKWCIARTSGRNFWAQHVMNKGTAVLLQFKDLPEDSVWHKVLIQRDLSNPQFWMVWDKQNKRHTIRNAEFQKVLVDHNITQDMISYTPEMIQLNQVMGVTMQAVNTKNPIVLENWLKNGIPVHWCGQGALRYAVRKGDEKVVRLLIKAGARANIILQQFEKNRDKYKQMIRLIRKCL